MKRPPWDVKSFTKASKLFHAYEWLRSEALKGNKHAKTVIKRLSAFEKLRKKIKEQQ